jgi:GNAT superfamily N-acetyltransferase
MTTNHTTRQAREEDAAELARLSAQLGYPASDDAMVTRLRRLLASPDDAVFVAAAPDGRLIGWIHGFLSRLLESDYRVEIGGLVVDEQFHRKGVGRGLVGQIEKWAAQRSVTECAVRCRTTRPKAHAFYESLGYGRVKTQIVFRKTLET